MKRQNSRSLSQLGLHLCISLVGISACAFAIWFTARVGYSRLVSKYAALTSNVAAANKAVEVAPLDPQVHRTRARILYHLQQVPEAARELEVAVSLRPRDDALWLELAIIRDEMGDPGALAAFNESVRLAPYYAHPSWQRGNFLLRAGRYADAFVDLRSAAASNPELVPSLIDLSWGVSKADADVTEQWAGITSDRMRMAFARFLARQGKIREALEQYHGAGAASAVARGELVQQMIAANAFREAFEVWSGANRLVPGQQHTSINDGGFENQPNFDDAGFGWRFSRALRVRLSLDSSQSHAGSKSLLVEFLGYSEPAAPLVSQLVLVEPDKRYRAHFAARTQDIVTGGLPLMTVSNATAEKRRLGQSAVVRQDTTAWQMLSIDFQTDSATQAVEFSLQRENCNSSPCPIFGSLWLDSFSIEELN